MILIIEVIRATAFQVILLFLPPTTTWGKVMDLHTRHWLDYDIAALAFLMISITMLELLVLGILGLLT